nr:MAG TPA: hypothetical protein [Caudoviricetes sp.]
MCPLYLLTFAITFLPHEKHVTSFVSGFAYSFTSSS